MDVLSGSITRLDGSCCLVKCELPELSKKELPSKFMLKLDESKVPAKVLEIMKKGQGKQDCCAAFTMMSDGCYSGTWGNGSMRFLHCVCKMIDDGWPIKGTTMVSARRAMKGWGTCDEELWPSNVDLSKSDFEDWKSIPKEAWEDAKQKRIRNNKVLVASWPSQVVNIDGRDFRLFTHCFNVLGEDKQYELTVIDPEFETVAWASLRAYVGSKQIILEDLFVKPEFRRAHHGKRLLHRIEQISCLEEPFSSLTHEILVPISVPDAGPTRYNATRDFFISNGYVWKNTEPIRTYPFDWSIFTAVKTLDCTGIRNDYAIELLNKKMHAKAEEQFIAALQMNPNAARVHANYAILLFELKRYDNSEKQLEQALNLDEQNSETHSVYANLMRELGRNKEAEKHYLRALELKEDFSLVHNNYANLLRKMGRRSDSETHFRRALEVEDFPEAHYSYALLLRDLKRYDEAEIHFQRALEPRKEFPEANKRYAELLSSSGRRVEAQKQYRHAIENKEDYADAHADYAFLLGNLKRYEESEEHYLRSIEIKEKEAKWVDAGYLNGELGGVYEEQGKLEQAEAHYAKVLEISTRIGHARLQRLASNDIARVREHLKKSD